MCIQIPVLVIPREKWNVVNIVRNPEFEVLHRYPRYAMLRKYVDIYRTFYFIDIVVQATSLRLESFCDITSRVTTLFKNIAVQNSQGKTYTGLNSTVKVDGKKLSLFLHSINHLDKKIDFKMKGKAFRLNYIQFNFKCQNNTVEITYVMAHHQRDRYAMDDHR